MCKEQTSRRCGLIPPPVAIADAIAESGDAKLIEVAQVLLARGDAAKAQGGAAICDVALDKYEEAWEKAVSSWCN